MNKTVERMITGGAIAALIVVFFYQVAYGQTAIVTAPPGSNITSLTITPISPGTPIGEAFATKLILAKAWMIKYG